MSDQDVRKAMLDEMDTLSEEIITTEAAANGLVEAAVELSDWPGAEAIREVARRHRVQALELRGQLAALREEYATKFHP